MFEAKKYNPENIQPYLFLRPPTLEVGQEVEYLSRQIANDLTRYRRKPHDLKIGTELEVFFFSPDIDPYEGDLGRFDNPNYEARHTRKLRRIKSWASNVEGDLGSPLHDIDLGELGVEFRTKPTGLQGYYDQVDSLRDHIRDISTKLDVLPVVHSQHIHVSLVGKNNPIFRRSYGGTEDVFEDRNKNLLLETVPLTLLPEEVDESLDIPFRFSGVGKSGANPTRMEYRALSSEYACDPRLNLLVSLRSLRDSLSRAPIPPVNEPTDFPSAVRSMRDSDRLSSFFGQSLLATLSHVVSQYPKVSRREIPIVSVKTKL